MALIVQTTSSIGAGVRVTLATLADTFVEIAGISVVSTDGADAVFSNMSAVDTVQIAAKRSVAMR